MGTARVIRTTTDGRTVAKTSELSLVRLMAWLSPAFPVGAYAYSQGLEQAIAAGLVSDAAGLTDWVGAAVVHGPGRLDADLFRMAWQAVANEDEAALQRLAVRGEAMRGSAELALESRAQGSAFLRAVAEAWPAPDVDRWGAVLRAAPASTSYAIAVATICAASGLAPLPALSAFLHAQAANLISAGVRLIPLGQTDGQRAMASLEDELLAAAEIALCRDDADIGSATPIIDLCSMLHETQYTRLFRS